MFSCLINYTHTEFRKIDSSNFTCNVLYMIKNTINETINPAFKHLIFIYLKSMLRRTEE